MPASHSSATAAWASSVLPSSGHLCILCFIEPLSNISSFVPVTTLDNDNDKSSFLLDVLGMLVRKTARCFHTLNPEERRWPEEVPTWETAWPSDV